MSIFRAANGNPSEYKGSIKSAYEAGYSEARGRRRRVSVFFRAVAYGDGPYYLQEFRDGISPVLALQPELNDTESIKLFRKIRIIE